jgi:hypothetical protein
VEPQHYKSGKRNFRDTNSLSELAVTFVLVSFAMAFAVLIVGSGICFMIEYLFHVSPILIRIFMFSLYGICLVLSLLLWRSFLRQVRRTPDIDLSKKGFFRFQIAITTCVFIFWLLVYQIPENGVIFVNTLRTLFEVLVNLSTIVYVTFAWGAQKKVPGKIFLGFLTNVGMLFLP